MSENIPPPRREDVVGGDESCFYQLLLFGRMK